MVLREFDLATRGFLPDGFHLPEGKSWSRLARPRHAVADVDGRAGHGHQRGLCAHRAALAPGHRPACGAGHFSGAAESVHVSAGVDRDSPDERLGSSKSRFHRRHSVDRRPRRSEDADRCSARCLAVVAARLARREASHPLERRGQRPTGPTRSSAFRLGPSWRETAASRSCSSRAPGAPCKSSSGAAVGSSSRSSTISSRSSRC